MPCARSSADLGRAVGLQGVDLLTLGLDEIALALQHFEGRRLAMFESDPLGAQLLLRREPPSFGGLDPLAEASRVRAALPNLENDRLLQARRSRLARRSSSSLRTTRLRAVVFGKGIEKIPLTLVVLGAVES